MKGYSHDKPFSAGAENVLKRVRQMIDLRWTPIRPLPSCLTSQDPDGTKHCYFGYFPEWRPQVGVPYSSCRTVEKYVGWNVSTETFLSALRNPNSVVYTRELKDQPGTRGNCYYGSVCSMTVSYALDLPYRVVCKDWPSLPDLHPVDTAQLENLRLCDIVVDPTHHVALITDIVRDEAGRVCEVEVSEETTPVGIRKSFTPEEFRHFWLEDGYSIYRYDKIDAVTYTPDPFIPLEGDPELPVPEINRDLMPDYGNRANYRIGDEAVELSVLTEGWETLEVTDPQGNVAAYPVTEKPLRLEPSLPGTYRARVCRGESGSAFVEWCMVDIRAALNKTVFSPGEKAVLRFDNAEKGDKVFHHVINTGEFYVIRSTDLTEEESSAGVTEFAAPEKAGDYNLILLARNNNGIYSSRYLDFRVE
ncbi:MAG: hypothetical protein II882_01260 [Lachnospiraceae bacterium]|nr:hypothetical protein [Lachnospiraceae bacterium]